MQYHPIKKERFEKAKKTNSAGPGTYDVEEALKNTFTKVPTGQMRKGKDKSFIGKLNF
jgi:hypothetical protein